MENHLENIKVGILGTRGIPNRYGGFEQWAEQLSVGLVKSGCRVSVYCSHFHPYKKPDFNGVTLIKKWDPKKLGLASQFIYDLLCILNARKQDYDVIIQLGYTTSSVWGWLLPRKVKIIYNMDGMEWKREKYKGLLKTFLKRAEKLAIKHSGVVIADSKPIKQYLDVKYQIQSVYIPYPATPFTNPDEQILDKFNLKKENYYLLIARFQPDNNLEMIIQGVLASNTDVPLVIIGDYQNRYGRYLRTKYNNKQIVFIGKYYDQTGLNNLRYHCLLYFHGHSAGGTNPSLLEAMASSCVISAHDNKYNRAVLEKDAFYFKNQKEIETILNRFKEKTSKANWIKNNLNKLRNDFNLNNITDKYYKLF